MGFLKAINSKMINVTIDYIKGVYLKLFTSYRRPEKTLNLLNINFNSYRSILY